MNEISDLLIILCWPLMTFCEHYVFRDGRVVDVVCDGRVVYVVCDCRVVYVICDCRVVDVICDFFLFK
jgi:hypothetical protein